MVTLLYPDQVEQSILFIRGRRVLLDEQLAAFYGVETRTLVQAVRRNMDRFPGDFMFQLTEDEWGALRSQTVISSVDAQPAGTQGDVANGDDLRSQSVTSNSDARVPAKQKDAVSVLRSQIATSKRETRGGRRYAPYAFTEQGVAMLSSVLRSKQAVAVNIEIMRAFVRLRQLLPSHKELSARIARLERAMEERGAEVDSQIEGIVALLAQLFNPPDPPRTEIGFHTGDKKSGRKKGGAK